jgi:hypothetical protein
VLQKYSLTSIRSNGGNGIDNGVKTPFVPIFMNRVCADERVFFAKFFRNQQLSNSFPNFEAAAFAFWIVTWQFLRVVAGSADFSPFAPQSLAIIFKRASLLPF